MMNYITYMQSPSGPILKIPWWQTQIEQNKPAFLRSAANTGISKDSLIYPSIEEGLQRMTQEGKLPTNLDWVDMWIQESNRIAQYRVPVNYSTAQKTEALKPIVEAKTQSTMAPSISKPKSVVQKKQIPQNLHLYVSSVDSNGNVFFNIPEGVSQETFEKAILEVLHSGLKYNMSDTFLPINKNKQLNKLNNSTSNTQQNISQPELSGLTTQPKAVQNSNSTNNHSLNPITIFQNKKNQKITPEKDINVGRRLSVYVYPVNDAHVYSIHPDVYTKVLEKLKNTHNRQEAKNNIEQYYISPYQLPGVVPGQTVLDSIYHFIDKTGADRSYYIRVPYLDKYYKNNQLIISYSQKHINPSVDGKSIINIVPEKLENYAKLLSAHNPVNKKWELELPINSKGDDYSDISKTTRFPNQYNKTINDYKSVYNRDAYINEISTNYTPSQKKSLIDTMVRLAANYFFSTQDTLPEDATGKIQPYSAQQLISLYNKKKSGGKLNYLNFFKK